MESSKFVSRLALGFFVGIFAVSCGGGSGGTTSTSTTSTTSSVALSTIDELPSSLAPVEASTSSSLSLAKGHGAYALAESGVRLDADPAEEGVLTQGSSMGACTSFNMAKEAINQAAFGALIQCYIQNIFASNQSVDIYDGEFHTIGMDWTGADEGEDGGGPSKVRMKIVKDSGGAITDFVLYACGGNGSEEQTEYLSQTISGSTFSMTEKGVHTDLMGEFQWGSTVGGTLTSTDTGTFAFTGTKTVDISFDSIWFSNDQEVGSGNGSISWLQQSDSAVVTGFMTGDSTFEGASYTYEERSYGALQLLDGNESGTANYDIGLLALGSGCLTGETSGTWEIDGFGENWGQTFEDCWNGDTWAVQDNDFSDDIVGAELPEASTQTVGFEGDEVYDCADEAESTLSMAEMMSAGLDFDAACAAFQLGHEYIDCWSTVQSGAEDVGGGGDLSSFDISSCEGSPSGTDSFLNQATGEALCTCFTTELGQGVVDCDSFQTTCAQSSTVNDCVTALKAAQ